MHGPTRTAEALTRSSLRAEMYRMSSADAALGGLPHRPAFRPPRPGLVEHVVDQVPLARDVVFLGQDSGRALHQVALELGGVPLLEGAGHLVVRHAEHLAHDVVDLADELHVAVLDAVLNHGDVVAGSSGSKIGSAWFVVYPGSTLAE